MGALSRAHTALAACAPAPLPRHRGARRGPHAANVCACVQPPLLSNRHNSSDQHASPPHTLAHFFCRASAPPTPLEAPRGMFARMLLLLTIGTVLWAVETDARFAARGKEPVAARLPARLVKLTGLERIGFSCRRVVLFLRVARLMVRRGAGFFAHKKVNCML